MPLPKLLICLVVFLLSCASLQAQSSYTYTPCTNGTVWQPTLGTTWMWYLAKDLSVRTVATWDVQVYDFDMFYVTPEIANAVHAKGSVLICYIDTAYEDWRPDSTSFLASDLGHKMDGWEGQKWVNIESANIRSIMENRLYMAWQKGCDAIEWDDVDAFKNNPGFNFNGTAQANFNAYLARITHSYNMSVGLKNDLTQIALLEPYYDWIIDEQCYQYDECDTLQPFHDMNKAVFGAEYKNSASKICSSQNSLGFSWIRTSIDLDGTSTTLCCSYNRPQCAGAPYVCATPPTDYPYLIDNSATRFYTSFAVLACMLLAILI